MADEESGEFTHQSKQSESPSHFDADNLQRDDPPNKLTKTEINKLIAETLPLGKEILFVGLEY